MNAKIFTSLCIMDSKPTLKDVAALANVSVSTASKALHHTERISARTQRIVFAAAESIGYRKSNEGRPTRAHSGLIGLVTSDYNGRFALPMLNGAESTLGASNHAALLMSSRGSPSLEKSHIDQLAAQGVDGLIMIQDTTGPRDALSLSETRGLPVIYAYAPSSDEDDCSIICDNVGAGFQAIEYLLSLGRRRIAVIAGTESFQASKDRVEGALRAFRYYDEQAVDIMYDIWSEEWGEHAALSLLDRFGDVDALYCLSDEIARGAIHGIMQRGLSVPKDVAVIGHDNWFVFSTNSHPTLTTFDNNIETIGKISAQYLIDAIHGHPHHGITTVECPMIVRESTEATRKTPLQGSGKIFSHNSKRRGR
ncbi:MAG: LacI family DNA-binding transcriptional regulator [Bifidobacterium psychraerophilum]